MQRHCLSAAEARRVALAAQGFASERPASRGDVRHFRRVINSLGLLQLDFVNVLMPAHYLVMWSRLGAFDRERFHKFVYGSGEYTEHWAHEASIVPIDSWPSLAYRRDEFKPWATSSILKLRNHKAYLRAVLEQVERDGALTASHLPQVAGPKRKPGDWHRSVPRSALELHFGRGNLAVAGRLPNYQRVYDLPERLIPSGYRSSKASKDDGQRDLLCRAARALGIATLRDLADYYRMAGREAAPRVQELVDSGELLPVTVEGWTEPAYLAASARCPRNINRASLLSPFDPVVWFRPRAKRIFDFEYRIEIYVPAEKRRWGYYVLPFLVGDRIVARVDLKADRQAGELLVLAAHEEANSDREICVARLANELQELQEWLGLSAIHVRRHNSYSRALAAAVRNSS
jgi:uncharacterized protein YcaQ